MKRSGEYKTFTEMVDKVLAVPNSVIKERIEEHRKRAAKNPNRRGPKRKAKPSASPASNGRA